MNTERRPDDAWSGDVPTTPPPTSFEFPSSTDRAVEPDGPRPTTARNAGGAAHHAETNAPARRRFTLVIATVIALAIASAAWVGSRRSSTDGTANAPVGSEAAGDSVSSGPPVDSDEPPLVRTTLSAPVTTRVTVVPRTTAVPVPAVWVDGHVVLPERLGQITPPSELVALTDGGKVLRIDLGTGQTSTFDLDQRRPGSTLHLGATTALVSSNNKARGPMLLPLGGSPIPIDEEVSSSMDVLGPGPGPDEFTAYVWGQSSGIERAVVIKADGAVVTVDDDVAGLWNSGHVAATGERWIGDAGGVYLEAPDGSVRRISTGVPVTTSGSKFLVRECDEQRRCGLVMVDVETDERISAETPDDFMVWNQPIQALALSPDGRSLLVTFWNDQEATLIDLTTGGQTTATVEGDDQYGNAAVAWSPDSSGYFAVEQGDLTFTDRSTGENTVIAIEFDDTDVFVDVDIRPA